ncbi:hypothetical protein MAPG_11607 [Magnaporthiopsis poae ATCC 64411]|uniref:Carboxylic ester hydrolase n=1 Tax=Magnaporthiopsis poae (strain ATCC 64411 / 73-15) TaxID=644358 RepID=A0A0C4EFQ1_MAGP6|nr:hypothetical protein MAPG_11607 [Magnaporthiopsis poae ATCC 64411]
MSAPSLASLCVPATFGTPSLFGIANVTVAASIASINATLNTWTFSRPTRHVSTTFCNVTVSYTHPGQNDWISVEAWLPSPSAWNDVLVATGGGGLGMGRNSASYGLFMSTSIDDGYAAVTTDAGHPGDLAMLGGWALLSNGNADQISLHNAAARSLEEQGLLGKQIVEAMYGRKAAHSYFSSCSQGGRQALMVSQRYPDLYDGIVAAAPAMSLDVVASILWPQQYMVNQGHVPHECEMHAVTVAAVAFCDALDGVEDGVVADPALCLERFDPFSVVGRMVNCSDAVGGKIAVSAGAAAVVNATWHGPRYAASGKQVWPGFRPGADITGSGSRENVNDTVANTVCNGNGTCVGRPWPIAATGFRTMLARDLSLDLAKMTNAQFEKLTRYGHQELRSFAATDPDLTEFQRAGGKMLSYHGMADNIIPPEGTSQYYQQVTAVSPDVHSFYRLFEIPGLGHCFSGSSGPPAALFSQLRAWVENGTAPGSTGHELLNQVTGNIDNRLACPFPHKPRFDVGCGDVGREACWSCPEL